MDPKRLIILIGIIVAPILILIIVLIAISLQKIESKEIGLQYDNVAKTLDEKTMYEGLYNGPPGFYFIKFPSVFETMSFDEITCLNFDGIEIKLKISYQFKAEPLKLYTIVTQFKDFNGYKKIVKSIGNATIHDICANFTTEMFQSKRGLFQEMLLQRMKLFCKDLYCELNDLQVINVERPDKYEKAVRSKEAAKEDIKIALNERPRQLIIAERELDKARKQAEMLLNDAQTKVQIINIRAENEKKALEFRYQKDLEIYKKVKDSQGLSNEGLISYIGIQNIASSKNDINLGIASPAITSFKSIKDEL